MKLSIDGCYGRYTLEETEPATAELCNDLILAGRDAGTLNVDLLVHQHRMGPERLILEAHGFSYAGSQQMNENLRPVTYAIFRHCVRTADGYAAGSGETSELATPMPLLPSSDAEKQAQSDMQRTYSQPLSPERLKYLMSIGKQPDPEPARDLLADKLRAEIAELETECAPSAEPTQPEATPSTYDI